MQLTHRFHDKSNFLFYYIYWKKGGVYKKGMGKRWWSIGRKWWCWCVNYLPWTRPLNTWLFPARVASHSTEDNRVCEREITTCFISGRNTGSWSTHCFASMTIYARTKTHQNAKYNESLEQKCKTLCKMLCLHMPLQSWWSWMFSLWKRNLTSP